MRIVQISGLVVGLFATSTAFANTGLQYDWEPGTEHRFVISNQTIMSSLFFMYGQDNLEKRIDEWRLNMAVTCEGKEAISRRVTRVDCRIDDFAMQVLPYEADLPQTDELVQEWDHKLTGATVRIGWRNDGKFTSVELRGVKHDRTLPRTRDLHWQMRTVMERAFAGLEVQLPKKGDSKGKHWTLRDPMLYGFPVAGGTTTGALVGKGRVEESRDGQQVLSLTGEGTRGPNPPFQTVEVPPNMWNMRGTTDATFDPELGVVTRAESLVEGKITPSSQLASGPNVKPYTQATTIERVEGDVEVDFPPSGLIVVSDRSRLD